ncbi:MAG: ABC transporter ATP-binding protein [Hyphomicrobiaceae bacterium]
MSEPLLSVRDLVKHFVAAKTPTGRATSFVRAVDGVSFDVATGETLAIVGESGCGKSTVGRLVLRLLEPTAGAVSFEGRSLSHLTPAALRAFRARAQLIFQDPYGSLNPRQTIGETIGEPLHIHSDLTRADRRNRTAELLELVGLKAAMAPRYPHEFSGGQRQRIAIARALAANPKFIVCDEPVSALDVSVRSQVLNLLRDLQERFGLAYLFISHDLAAVKHVADRVAVMYLGRIVEEAPTAALFGAPRHPYTRALLSAIPMLEPGRPPQRVLLQGDPPSPVNPPPGCHLHPRCPYAQELCASDPPPLERSDDGRAQACHFWKTIPPPDLPHRNPAVPGPIKQLLAAFDAGALD